jgi:hypothetical protein
VVTVTLTSLIPVAVVVLAGSVIGPQLPAILSQLSGGILP